jgi:hypothetical protein
VNFDLMSYVIATGNVTSMILVGPMVVLLMAHLRWPRRRMLVVSMTGWAILWAAQLLMWRVFGHAAGYPGFEYVQPLAFPVSCGNLCASLWLSRPAPDRAVSR